MNNPVIESAAKGQDHAMGSEHVICECGERLSLWDITAQLSKRAEKAGRQRQSPELASQLLKEWIVSAGNRKGLRLAKDE